MTRINCIKPIDLSSRHLVAEYRELPRIFALAERSHERGEILTRSERYILGTGHVKFFYGKLRYLRSRHAEIVTEMKSRGFKTLIDVSFDALDLPSYFQYDWVPQGADQLLNLDRLIEREPMNARYRELHHYLEKHGAYKISDRSNT